MSGRTDRIDPGHRTLHDKLGGRDSGRRHVGGILEKQVSTEKIYTPLLLAYGASREDSDRSTD